jgi:DHA2 family methylenomycin A resistance protein-like MFS transporter
MMQRNQGRALLATSLGFGVVQLDVSVVNVAVTPIGADLGGSIGGLQWVVNAYTVAFAALLLSAGALGDRIGAKRVFIAGFALFTVASVGCGSAPTLGWLITSRAVQGVGAAALVPCSLALLNHAYPDGPARTRAIGLWAAGASAALSAGPLVGGVLTATLGWRAIFFINVPIGLAGILLTARHATETTRSRRPAGLRRAGLRRAGSRRAGSRRAEPMLPVGVLRPRTFAAMSGVGLLVNVAFYGLIFLLGLYFETTRHYSALATGLAFAPSTAAVLAANLGAGRLTRTFGTQAVLTGAALLMAASLGGLLVVGPSTAYVTIVVQLSTLGLGLGLLVPAMTAAMLGSVDASRSGLASGMLTTARQTGSVIGVALFGSLAAGQLVVGLRWALVVGGVLMLVVAVVGAGVERSRVGVGAS